VHGGGFINGGSTAALDFRERLATGK